MPLFVGLLALSDRRRRRRRRRRGREKGRENGRGDRPDQNL